MAKFNVNVTIRLEIEANFILKASTQQQAEEKAQIIIDSDTFGIRSWLPTATMEKLQDIDLVEAHQTAELDAVEKM